MDNLSDLITIALFLIAIGLIEYMHYRKDNALLKEREQLLNRIQAKDLIEYNNVVNPVKHEPKEPKKLPNYL